MSTEQPSTTTWITTSPTVLDGKPRVKDTRLGVHFIVTQIISGNSGVEAVADQYSLPVEAVQAAVDYYHSHPEKMEAIDRQRTALVEEAKRNPAVPTTPSELADFGNGTRSASD